LHLQDVLRLIKKAEFAVCYCIVGLLFAITVYYFFVLSLFIRPVFYSSKQHCCIL